MTTMGLAGLQERAAELEQLSAMLTAAASGRGQVCPVEGPSGSGKSRLLDECAILAEAAGMRVLRARCSELSRDYSFGVARNLFEGIIFRSDADTRATLMQGPAALAEPVFGRGEAADVFGVVHGLYWLTVNLADQRPLAILIDDIAWADDLSLRFFAYLDERLDDTPVALVIANRTGDPGAQSHLVTHLLDAATTPPIQPRALSGAAVEAVLAEALPGHEVDAELARSVVRDTGGNPFLVVAVARAMRAGEDTQVTTPALVRQRIALRLARLQPGANALAKAASVLGDETALRDAARLAGIDPECGMVAADELVIGHFFDSADPITFAHRIVRMAVYDLLEPGERVTLHSGAAKLLASEQAEAEVVAEHLLKSGPTREAWALTVLHKAGRAAARKGTPAAALRYLRPASDVADSAALPPGVLVDLGLAEAAAGEPISLSRFEEALNLIDDPDERAEALFSFGRTLYQFSRYAEASVAFRRGAQLFEGRDEQVRLRFEGTAWGADFHLTTMPDPPSGSINGDGPGTRAILAVRALHDSLVIPPAGRSADLAIRALGNGALLAELSAVSPCVNLATLALLHTGRVIEAQAAADATVRDARERGAQLAHAATSIVRAQVLYVRGRISEAAADAQAAFDVLQQGGHAHQQTALAALVHCMIERGELKEAAAMFERDDLVAPVPALRPYVSLARGRLHLRCGDIDEARRDVEAVENAFRDVDTVNPAWLPWRSLAGLIALASGDGAGAHALCQEEVRLAQLFEVPIPLGVALHRRALTESGSQALETFEEAIDVLKATEAKLHLARAHYGIGRRLRRAGQRVDARRHLAAGLDLAYRSGASGLEAELRDELTAAGARPRRTSVTGLEALTPTELRVAQLATDGMSNREIAEQMFVSRNTVAWHLRNIYRKVEVESREELRRRINE
jgi:DNA-binding CsgD family transcriptional regulator